MSPSSFSSSDSSSFNSRFAPPSPGAGSSLPTWLLALCGAFTAVATAVSVMSITLQLKNYRKPSLQRAVVRIMVMVPLYAISSLIALFSLEAAFFIDAVRDLYEAFVIYTFFQLLITYLGGERSLLIILHGRPPIPHPFPVNLFLRPMDVSDPWTLLNLKRGVLQYVQVKPVLVLVTVILKATGTYQEGRFAGDSGYTYISVAYNTSICLSLYCLAMFWVCVNDDLTPFRPVPKFLCVKGILFFSFWQSIGISFLVAVKAIKRVGVYTDAEHMALALVDSLICFEMPIFAIAHQYAFQASDYIDNHFVYKSRLPFMYALRDSFGLKDVWEDTKHTLKGRGVSYQAYEPAEGGLHYGAGRQKRIRAGLRYSKGGKAKYWVPLPGDEARSRGDRGPIAALKRRVDDRLATREGYAPLLPKQASEVVHDDPDAADNGHHVEWSGIFDTDSDESDAPSLDFHGADAEEDNMYERARRIGYAGFPNIDVSREERRRRLWEEEDGILAGRWNRGGPKEDAGHLRPGRDRARSKSGGKGKGKDGGKSTVYGAWADRSPQSRPEADHSETNGHSSSHRSAGTGDGQWLFDGDNEHPEAWRAQDDEFQSATMRWTKKQLRKVLLPPHPKEGEADSPFAIGEEGEPSDNEEAEDPKEGESEAKKKLPSDAVDLVVEDPRATERAHTRERRRGEPQTGASHVLRHKRDAQGRASNTLEEVHSPVEEDEGVFQTLSPEKAPGGDPMKHIEEIEATVEADTPPLPITSGLTSPYGDDENPWA